MGKAEVPSRQYQPGLLLAANKAVERAGRCTALGTVSSVSGNEGEIDTIIVARTEVAIHMEALLVVAWVAQASHSSSGL